MNKTPILLYRRVETPFKEDQELIEAQKHFHVVENRVAVSRHTLVIGRYSVLPFYKELETDIKQLGGELINSFQQHQFIADLKNWTETLYGYTPYTYDRLEDLPDKGPFVLKGETNSKKHLWNSHMYAENKAEAIRIFLELSEDSLIGSQKIYIRDYVPLVKLAEGINGLPISKEFRFFICDGKILSGAFYWSNYVEDLKEVPKVSEVPQAFLEKVIRLVGDKARFWVVDVAQTVSGDWIVIELNDGQMSGLSENDPYTLYKNLRSAL